MQREQETSTVKIKLGIKDKQKVTKGSLLLLFFLKDDVEFLCTRESIHLCSFIRNNQFLTG